MDYYEQTEEGVCPVCGTFYYLGIGGYRAKKACRGCGYPFLMVFVDEDIQYDAWNSGKTHS